VESKGEYAPFDRAQHERAGKDSICDLYTRFAGLTDTFVSFLNSYKIFLNPSLSIGWREDDRSLYGGYS
jgi:hypothetical protein